MTVLATIAALTPDISLPALWTAVIVGFGVVGAAARWRKASTHKIG